MPDTPIDDARVAPEVSPGAALPMAATPQAFGAGLGEGVQQVGEVAAELHQHARLNADRTMILDADNQTNAFLNDRLYNGQTGLLHQSPGRNAPAAVDQTLADFDKHVAAVSASLTDDRQRIAYQRMAKNRRMDLDRTLGEFEHKETNRDADEVDQAAIAAAGTNVAQNPNNPKIIGKNIGHIQEVIATAGQRKGLPPEAIAEQQAQAVSATNHALIYQLVSTGQDQQAKAWYNAHKGELTAKDAPEAAHLVEAGSLAGEAFRRSDAIVKGDDGVMVDRVTANARVQAIDDPKLRQEVQTRVDQRFEQAQKEKQEADGATVNQAFGILKDPGNKLGAGNPQYVALKASLPWERQEQLTNAEHKEIPEFSTASYDLDRMVGTEAFLHADLSTYRGQVPDHKLDKLAELQGEQARKGTSSAKVALAETQTRLVDDALEHLGFYTPDLKKSDDAKTFRDHFDQMHLAEVAQNGGKPIPQKDLEDIAKRLQADYVVRQERSRWNPARWFGSNFDDNASQGPLYKQPDAVIARQIPVLGTERASTGEPMTAGTVQDWVQTLVANPQAPGYRAGLERLRQMRQGLAEDGTSDPAMLKRYQAIHDAYIGALNAAKAAP